MHRQAQKGDPRRRREAPTKQAAVLRNHACTSQASSHQKHEVLGSTPSVCGVFFPHPGFVVFYHGRQPKPKNMIEFPTVHGKWKSMLILL